MTNLNIKKNFWRKYYGFDYTAKILDCACGIGTQSIGIAK